MLLCGDFNSTPNSHLLSFLTTSHLDYAHLSALVIAGYFEGGARSRTIPVPLLPAEMNIGADCVYSHWRGGAVEGGASDVGTGNGGSGGDVTTGRTGASKCEGCGSKAQPSGHSEFTSSDVEGILSDDTPIRTTRSVRGGKGKGHGISASEFRSLQGGAKRGCGEPVWEGQDELKVGKSSPSCGGSSVEDNEGGGDGSQQRGCGGGGDSSTTESLKSSTGSVGRRRDKARHEDKSSSGRGREVSSSQGDSSGKSESKRGEAMLTHPFKLLPAYPVSKSPPSTVTTYHQCAFETVDYIFFSPISCRTSGGAGGKTTLAGFNLLKRRVLPSTHTLLDLGPQPHQFLSSDHLLLQATFQLAW